MSGLQIEDIAIVHSVPSGHPTGIHIVTQSGHLDDGIRKLLGHIGDDIRKFVGQSYALHGIQDHPEYNEDALFMEISLGCGGSLIIPTINDFPETDVSCTCGDPDGYLIKYEKMEGER